MQTFLPYPDFTRSAHVLDYRRLGKQRIEAKQILLALQGGSGWANHPATTMWRASPGALIEYAIAMCTEWRARGYVDNQLEWFKQQRLQHPSQAMPKWLGDRAFHESHMSNLVRKQPEHYRRFFAVPDNLPYIWPSP